MVNQPEILELIARYLNNPTDLESKFLVDKFRNQSKENNNFFIEIERLWEFSQRSAVLGEVDASAALEKFEKRLSLQSPTTKPKAVKLTRTAIFRWAVAAIFIIGVAGMTYFYFKGTLTNELEKPYASDAKPGGNKAILVLANGRKISLTDVGHGDVAKEAGLSITKTADGQLVYNVISTEGNGNADVFNTIETPKGGMWEVRLPDGSVVWLNAASSLTYPIAFSKGKKRIVELKGEAYFEVAKDKLHPFVVRTTKQDVEVLGTSFNVNSYTDEVAVKTTLLEGSVKVIPTDLSAKDLMPDEQAVLLNNEFTIKKVDASEAIDWKNGYFMFNNERQESIMKKIARWYNVKVEYADPRAKDVTYYGSISKFENVSKVLRKFEKTGEVRFEVEGNKIIVFKENTDN